MKVESLESISDIVMIVNSLRALGSDRDASPQVRELAQRSAHLLNESRSLMQSAVETLDKTAALRAGLMDSMSRHDEIARQKNLVMLEQAGHFRSLLRRVTPGVREATPAAEVI